ncbi:unnamed protein product, partial [Meganyctiphanes norvegica]
KNPLLLVASYTTETYCTFNSWRFPFDTQHCCIYLTLKDVHYNDIRLLLESKNIDVAKSVTQTAGGYDVETAMVNVQTTLLTAHQVLAICMTFGHDAHFHMAVIYLPSLFLFFCVYATLFVNLNRIKIRLLIGMLCMVGVVAVFWGTSVMHMMPESPTVTLLEVWALYIVITGFTMLFTQIIVFFLLRKSKDEGRPTSTTVKVAPVEGTQVGAYTNVPKPDLVPYRINLALQIVVGVASFIFFLWYIIYIYV